MSTRMLIDARHSEETRVTVVKGNRVEEFDYESAARRQLKGNIYLARVTRVEPSLQAAFVEYGGNRHGFLAFSEIHPDYFQIPMEDREAMLEAEREAVELMGSAVFDEEDEEEAEAEPQRRTRRRRSESRRGRRGGRRNRRGESDEAEDLSAEAAESTETNDPNAGTETTDHPIDLAGAPQPGLPDADPIEYGAIEPTTDTNKDTGDDLPSAEQHQPEADANADADTSAKDDGDKTLFEDTGIEDEDTPSEEALSTDAATTKDETPAAETSASDEPAPEHDVASDEAEDDIVDTGSTAPEDKTVDETAIDNDDIADTERDDEPENESDEDEPVKAIRPRREPTQEEIAAAARRRMLRSMKRKYSIQEVIKKRQIILVQVVKEERGNKGAALTTYLSLAGRYCVLMPNSTHSGGISRKISSSSDRKRLKSMISDLKVPTDMGLIVRTAGVSRTKAEITRDYDYLLRLWNDIRALTMKSVAPCLIYEEADLIRRAIRDMYTREIDEILVEGEAGFNTAKDSMKLLMPSHAKKVQHYKNRIPLYHRYQVEQQLESMYQPVCTLPSGGYIVINPTEALISIDVNSGKSTKEHNIEETALKTNLEATDEVARQLRLRDMAGLVVIDYIDMEDHRNNRAVERRMKEALKSDRARVQVEKISGFGLMEMSRQRLRPNLLEASTVECPHCHGAGIVRSVEAAALVALRKLEEEAIRSKSHILELTANSDVAGYLLNAKRRELSRLEERYTVRISITAELGLLGPTDFTLTRTAAPIEEQNEAVITQETSALESDAADSDDIVSDTRDEEDEERGRGRRRRRRGGRGRGRAADADAEAAADSESRETGAEAEDTAERNISADDDETRDGRGRKRGRRGGRRRRGGRDADTDAAAPHDEADALTSENTAPVVASDETVNTAQDTESEKPRRRRRRKKPEAEAAETAEAPVDAAAETDAATAKTPQVETAESETIKAPETVAEAEAKPAKPRRRRRTKAEIEADKAAKAAEKAAQKAEKEAKKEASGQPSEEVSTGGETTTASEPDKQSEQPADLKPEPEVEAAPDSDQHAETETAVEPQEPQVKAPAPTIVPAKPQGTTTKKGWWQRALKRD